jgi:hypothetical protein
MIITPRDNLNQSKSIVFIFEIDLVSLCFSRFLSQIYDDETSIVLLLKSWNTCVIHICIPLIVKCSLKRQIFFINCFYDLK